MLNSSYKIAVRTRKTVSQAPNTCNYTSLLLNMNGANNSTVFTDLSTHNHTITVNGNAKISTAQSKFGGGSAFFDGTGDSLSSAYNSAFNLGTGDFTIECFVYITGNSPQASVNYYNSVRHAVLAHCINSPGYATGWAFTIYGNSTTTGTGLAFQNWVNSRVNAEVVLTTTITKNTWHHVAASRSGTTTRVFLNGSLSNSGILSYQNLTNFANPPLGIGRLGSSLGSSVYLSGDLNGYIDEFRLLKGQALYTSSFTPPTAPFDSCRTGILNGSRANTLGFSGNGTATSKKSLGGRILCYPDITFTALQSGTLRLTADLVESNCFTEDEFVFLISNPTTTTYSPCSNVTNLNLSYPVTAGQTILVGYQNGNPYITNPQLWIE